MSSGYDRIFRDPDPDAAMRWALRVLDNNGCESTTFERYCPYCDRTTPHSVYAGRVSCTGCGKERPKEKWTWDRGD